MALHVTLITTARTFEATTADDDVCGSRPHSGSGRRGKRGTKQDF